MKLLRHAEFDVLAFGGDDSIRAVYSSAELYDSLTASWKVLVSLPLHSPRLLEHCENATTVKLPVILLWECIHCPR